MSMFNSADPFTEEPELITPEKPEEKPEESLTVKVAEAREFLKGLKNEKP